MEPRGYGEAHMLTLLPPPSPEGENSAGRPFLGSSCKPSSRRSKKRLRHLLTICRGVSNLEAITSLGRPCAAKRTILARITSLYGDVYDLDNLSRQVLSSWLSTMTYGLFLGIVTPPFQSMTMTRLDS